MKEKPFKLKPTLGIRMVLTVLCAMIGAVIAFYWFR